MTTETRRYVYQERPIEEFVAHEEPYYVPIGNEVELFEAAYEQKIPVILKGPTGCGKTRFVEHMAWRLGRSLAVVKANDDDGGGMRPGGIPVITVACHEDLTASDLVGRYLLEDNATRWIDGPLT
ncbi:MAG: AAA family ATPase, partial [Chloroflexi bacterium]|nr:AAA family ATPase [Chloroflexota bacterium]